MHALALQRSGSSGSEQTETGTEGVLKFMNYDWLLIRIAVRNCGFCTLQPTASMQVSGISWFLFA